MAVYAEWFWSCDQCPEECEEPWGDEQSAADDYTAHVADAHPELTEQEQKR